MRTESIKRIFALLLVTILVLTSAQSVVLGVESGGQMLDIIAQDFNSNTGRITFADSQFTVIRRPADGSMVYTPYVSDGSQDGSLLSQKVQGGKAIASLVSARTGKLTFEGDFRLDGPVGGTGGAVQFFDFYTASGASFLKFGCSGGANTNGYKLRAAYISNGAWTGTTVGLQLGGADVPYMTWHTLRVELDTVNGTMNLWVDSQQLLESVVVSLSNNGNLNFKSVQSYHNAATSDTTGQFMIDNLLLTVDEPTAPVVENVTVSGITMAGSYLRVLADIRDINGDTLDTPTYQWQRSDSIGGNWTDIEGATSQEYLLTQEDIDKYIRAGVTPVSTAEPATGIQAFSPAAGPVFPITEPPSITGEVTILGMAEVGNPLTAGYTYHASDTGFPEGATAFLWERSSSEQGDYIPVATSPTYTSVFADRDQYIRVTVTPVDTIGLAGEARTSAPIKIITDVTSIVYHVSADGSDLNSGTQEEPFLTLEGARKAIRSSGVAGGIPITVYFHGGIYDMSQSVSFTAADSGSAEFPIVYKAFGDGEVHFKGSKTIDASLATAVTDTEVLDRIISPDAKNKIMRIDLKAQGLTDIPSIPDSYGFAKGGWQPMEIYFNNTALTLARWPNASFLTINYTDSKTSGYTLGYEDVENRTGLWDKEKVDGDIFLWGNIGYEWAGGASRIASLDTENKRLTAAGSTQYAPMMGRKFYFFNLIEEIDLPGECYLDRETGMLYFYPPSDVATAEMEASVLTSPMLVMNGTSNIIFEGLTFTMTRAKILDAVNVDSITINNCELSHTSSNAVTLSGSNFTLENSHIYDLGGNAGNGGIHISGGDRVSLTPSGHVIRNNKIHSGDRVYAISQSPLIHATGVGHVIQNNEIYDATAYAVRFVDANNIQFIYNEVYDAVLLSSDAGAVTWGRDPTMLGIEVKYNYFHDIGNDMGGYGQQSVFTDDGAAGGKIFGNIFHKSTLTKEMGGTINDSFALKTNGGQFMTVENNIFIDVPAAVSFQSWDTGFSGGLQGRWWLWVQDKYGTPINIWPKMQAVGFDSDIWKSYYANTQWKWLNELFSSEFYNENVKNVTDTATLTGITLENAPSNTGRFDNNVTVKVDSIYRNGNNNVTTGVNYSNETHILSGGQSMFLEYGKDFKLTEAGLAEVRETLPDFENIPTERIGLMPFIYGGTQLYVGGREPDATGVQVDGSLYVGGIAKAKYTYDDPDGDQEGPTRVYWYYAVEEEGPYRRMGDMTGSEIMLDARYEGKYIRFKVTPYDINMVHGETKWAEPVFVRLDRVGDKSVLGTLLAQAHSLVAGADVGDDEGQYSQGAVNALNDVIVSVQAIMDHQNSSQYDVDHAAAELDEAIQYFIKSANTFSNMERLSLNDILNDNDGWVLYTSGPTGVGDGELNLSGAGSFASYRGEKYLNKLYTFTFKQKLLGGWNAIYFRQKDPDALSWASGNEGYLIAIKPDAIELQTRDGKSTRSLEQFPNLYIQDDTEYIVEIGAYDVNETDTRIIMKVNGNEVFNRLQEDGRMTGKEGYFGVYVGNGSMTLGPVTEAAEPVGEVTLSGNSTAFVGEQYELTYGLKNASDVTAQDVVINFDENVFELIGAYSLEENTAISDTDTTTPGSIRLVLETIGAGNTLKGDLPVVKLTFRVKAAAEESVISITRAELANGIGDLFISEVDSLSVRTRSQEDQNIDNGGDDETTSPPTQETPTIVKAGNTTTVTIRSDVFEKIADGEKSVKINAEVADIIFDARAVNAISNVASGGSINIVITEVDRALLTSDAQKKIGDRPVYDFTVKAGNTEISQFEGGKVEIRIPYVLKPVEKKNSVVIYYIDNSGKLKALNGKYDEATGTVNFKTTHFSTYAIGYNDVNFSDVKSGIWYEEEVGFMAARGFISGVGNGRFEPSSKVTRADFLIMVMKSYGIEPDTQITDNFADAGNKYYTSYLGTAKRLGMVLGTGNNKYRPEAEISRQDMMVMLHNILDKLGEFPSGNSGRTFGSFADYSDVEEYAVKTMKLFAETGITVGDGINLNPNATTTREQAAQILYNLLTK